MISSVPYVPPDTMKNVAATNGQSVSFAALFFGVESTWEGTWAGTDMLLNFYSRPPRRSLSSSLRWNKLATKGYKVWTRAQEKSALCWRNFCTASCRFKSLPTALNAAFRVIDSSRLSSLLLPSELSFMKLVRFLALPILCTAATFAGAQQQSPAPRPITIADFFQIREVRDPQFSPDGQWIVYSVSSPNKGEDKSESRIWMITVAGGEAVALTAEGNSSSHPRWSPDGKWLAFLSSRE